MHGARMAVHTTSYPNSRYLKEHPGCHMEVDGTRDDPKDVIDLLNNNIFFIFFSYL